MSDYDEGFEQSVSKAKRGVFASGFAVETFDDLAQLPKADLRHELNLLLGDEATFVMSLCEGENIASPIDVGTAFLDVMAEDAIERLKQEIDAADPSEREIMDARVHICLLAGRIWANWINTFGDLALRSMEELAQLYSYLHRGSRALAAALKGADGAVCDGFMNTMTPFEILHLLEQRKAHLFSKTEVAAAREYIRSKFEVGDKLEREWASLGTPDLPTYDDQKPGGGNMSAPDVIDYSMEKILADCRRIINSEQGNRAPMAPFEQIPEDLGPVVGQILTPDEVEALLRPDYINLRQFEDLTSLSVDEMRAVLDALFVGTEHGVAIVSMHDGIGAIELTAAFSGASEGVRNAILGSLYKEEARRLTTDIVDSSFDPAVIANAQDHMLKIARKALTQRAMDMGQTSN